MKELTKKIGALKTAKDLDKTLLGVTNKTLKKKPGKATPQGVVKNII